MKVPQTCIDEFQMIRKGINDGIFAIEKEALGVHSIIPREEDQSWENFVSTLPEDKCCHVFTHFPYIAESDNVSRSKFIHILWAPSKASQKDKMQLTFFAQSVLSDLGATGAARIEAGSQAALDYNTVREKVVRRLTVK